MPPFDLSGALRRIRRSADLSQRELARACGVSQSAVAQAESGRRDLAVGVLAGAAHRAGLRLALLDAHGCEVPGMSADAVRDSTGRRFPAHLDTHCSDDRWWRYVDRYDRSTPDFTVDLDRAARDGLRQREGTPEDHHLVGSGDSPQERRARRLQEVRRRRDEEWQRLRDSGRLRTLDDLFRCDCPPACDGVDDGNGPPRHAPGCPCGCDRG